MFIPQVLYIVEMNDVDVSHAFSQASPDLRMVFPLRRCRQSRNMEIMTGGTVTVIAAQNPPPGERLGVDAFGSREPLLRT